MAVQKATFRLGVVGFGPRGLGAIEALAAETAPSETRMKVDIFDPFKWPGSGPNFDPEQSIECILNIPVRSLDINPPEFMSNFIQPFANWSDRSYDPDDFPPRSDLGAYLNARFEAMCHATEGRFDVTHSHRLVTELVKSADGWMLVADKEKYGPYDEVLLTQGQPETTPDDQITRWAQHASRHELELTNSYPANELLDAAEGWTGKTVAVRGLGLSTFDVVRLLTKGQGGAFEGGKYLPSGKEPRAILPFSLTGLPPAAKPATQCVDDLFDPTERETEEFVSALNETLSQDPDTALKTICEALITPSIRICNACSGAVTPNDVRCWLDVERTDPGAQDTRDAIYALTSDIDMAYGRTAPTIGYTIGQIWRKWQDHIRREFNAQQQQPKTADAIVGFDEGLKRFSYGPPVSAAEEMLILIHQGVVSLSVVDDPAIILDPKGWGLAEDNDFLMASVMIDAVLPSPNLDTVIDPLIQSCRSQGCIHPVASGLGASSKPDGQLVNVDGCPEHGLSMLGRLTLGSVIAADSLHDCFGESTRRWARGVVDRNPEQTI